MEYPRPQAVSRYSVTFRALTSNRPVIIIVVIMIIIVIIIMMMMMMMMMIIEQCKGEKDIKHTKLLCQVV